MKLLLDDIYEGSAPSFEVDAFLKFFDTNKDGKISWSEFETGLGAAMAEQATQSQVPSLSLMPELSDDDDDDLEVQIDAEISGTCKCERLNERFSCPHDPFDR